MNNLTITKHIQCSFSNEDWDLYTIDYPWDTQNVADILNRALEKFVNSGYNKTETIKEMHTLMEKYTEFGTCDSEPMDFLDRVLREVYDR
jgi:hypothetical protein